MAGTWNAPRALRRLLATAVHGARCRAAARRALADPCARARTHAVHGILEQLRRRGTQARCSASRRLAKALDWWGLDKRARSQLRAGRRTAHSRRSAAARSQLSGSMSSEAASAADGVALPPPTNALVNPMLTDMYQVWSGRT